MITCKNRQVSVDFVVGTIVSMRPRKNGDRSAGVGFIEKNSYAYAPVLFAQGVILAGIVAGRVLYRGEAFLSFKSQIDGLIVFFVAVILGPLLMFTPRMARTNRKGLAEYGLFAERYVESFDQKWIRGSLPEAELLGTGEIQSLVDLGNGYQIGREMRVVPFGLQDISRLAIATAAPLAPLLLTIFSFRRTDYAPGQRSVLNFAEKAAAPRLHRSSYASCSGSTGAIY
jgi:hypothetical protein